jgi:hypothetical protein
MPRTCPVLPAALILLLGGTSSPGTQSVQPARAATADEVVQRAARTLEQYAGQLSLLIGVEEYAQYLGDESFDRAYKRLLVSEFALVRVKDDWLGFRDVGEIDGKPVADRQDRLRKLFLETPDDAVGRARRISDESARYNLGAIQRNFNVPTMALFFLQASNVARFKFSKEGEERHDGTLVWKIRYQEIRKPTIIRTSAGKDMPVKGTFWIDPTDGRVLKTHMEISVETAMQGHAGVLGAVTERGAPLRRVTSSASITVTYRADPAIGLLVPIEMRETYQAPAVNRFTGNEEFSTVNCRATYSHFKKFETGARLVPK